MEKLFAAVKLLISFIFISSLLSVGVMDLEESSEDWLMSIAAYLVLGLLSFFPLYYLIKTSIWDLKNQPFKKEVLVFLGIAVYFICIFGFIYMPYAFDAYDFIATSLFIGIIVLLISIRDLVKLMKQRKYGKR